MDISNYYKYSKNGSENICLFNDFKNAYTNIRSKSNILNLSIERKRDFTILIVIIIYKI